ncbi:hypothetical protein ACHAWF_011155 [Thalassiosira exigua]
MNLRRHRRGRAAEDDAYACPSAASFDGLDPSSYGYYDAIYDVAESDGFASSSRVGSVEVVPAGGGDNRTLAIARLATIAGFSSAKLSGGDKTLVLRGNGGSQIYGDFAGAMLAAHHFNNGVGDVVREATDVHERCPVRLSMEDARDSESLQTVAVDRFGKRMIEDPDRPPAALLGAWRSAVSVPLAILSGAYRVPQISPLSTSTELDDTSVYRYFGRLIPSDSGTAVAVIDYFTGLDVRHFGMLYVNDPYGSGFYQAINEASLSKPENERVKVRASPFSYNNHLTESKRDIELQIRQLKQTGYRYFFGVFYDEHYELVMEAAYRVGIAGPGYVWIISDGLSETYLDGRVYKPGSPLAVASQGIGILKAEGGRETKEGNSGYDRFAKAWYSQGSNSVNYYNCKQPKDNTINDSTIYYKAPLDFFRGQHLPPTAGAVFLYDSVMALGLAACELYNKAEDAYFNGEDLHTAFVSQSFEGASGEVAILPKTTSRDPKSAFFVLYNIHGEPDGQDRALFRVKTVAHTSSARESTKVIWKSFANETYVYSDGSTIPPGSLPLAEVNMNHLSPSARIAGITIAIIIFSTALFFCIWTQQNRSERVVKASQPRFLCMICVGAVVLGSTIIPLSIDDSVASIQACNNACMLNKIVAKVQQQTRMKVKVKDAMRPFFVVWGLNTIVLVSWTKVDPLMWVRLDTELIFDRFDRSIDSYGLCHSNNSAGWIAGLFIINFPLLILANYQAYKARNLSTEFSESKYVSIIMALMFEVVVIGLPVFILVGGDTALRFIVMTFLIGSICMSTLCLMFIPKMRALRQQLNQQGEENNEAIDETKVERVPITRVVSNVGDEDEEEIGIFVRLGALFRRRSSDGGGTSTEQGNAGTMTGRSIYVGRMISQCSSSAN